VKGTWKLVILFLNYICLTLKNGYTVIGENACANKEYFDPEYARIDSREKAVEKVWGLIGFLKKSYP
jgi:hypothetical protein